MVFDTCKHTNIKRKAEYRRIGKYYKSPERWKKERLLRKQALELQDQGLTNKDIAVKLGISKRTLQRIFAGTRQYTNRCKRVYAKYAKYEEYAGFELGFNGGQQPLSIKKELEQTQQLMRRWGKIARSSRDLTISVDVEAAVNGQYALRYKPSLPVNMLENSRITLELVLFGVTQKIGRIYVQSGKAKLDTNLSLNSQVKPELTQFKDSYNTAKKNILQNSTTLPPK